MYSPLSTAMLHEMDKCGCTYIKSHFVEFTFSESPYQFFLLEWMDQEMLCWFLLVGLDCPLFTHLSWWNNMHNCFWQRKPLNHFTTEEWTKPLKKKKNSKCYICFLGKKSGHFSLLAELSCRKGEDVDIKICGFPVLLNPREKWRFCILLESGFSSGNKVLALFGKNVIENEFYAE